MVAHRDVRPESLKKYGIVVTCLICFVFRCFEGWECGYSMQLTPGQKEACERLKDILVELPANAVQGGIGPDDDWFDENDLEDSEDSEDEDESCELEEVEAVKSRRKFCAAMRSGPAHLAIHPSSLRFG